MSSSLLSAASSALQDLQLFPSPVLPSPPNVPKRASVALILRVQPNPAHLPPASASAPVSASIAQFFEQQWVQHGQLEVLFIKRAARKGDRWTAHVAFPGGKRDPGDRGDLDTAVRETLEEVGLHLGSQHHHHHDHDHDDRVICCGHLPDRLITTSWGLVPLMVLCPYVFLLTSPHPPVLHLQPTEVASTHWVPLRVLVEPAFRTSVRCDIFDRLARPSERGPAAANGGLFGLDLDLGLGEMLRYVWRACLGQMEFTGIRLRPSTSYFSAFGPDYWTPSSMLDGRGDSLVLWGLTLGIVEDFLDMLPLPPPNGNGNGDGAVGGLFNWPTFTAWDVRLVVNLMSRRLRRRNLALARKESVAAAMLKEAFARERQPVDAHVRPEEETGECEGEGEEGPPPLSEARRHELKARGERLRISSFNTLMQGYDEVLRRAIWVTMAGRTLVAAAVVTAVAYRARR